MSIDHLGTCWGASTVGKQGKERSAGRPNKPRGDLNIGKDLRQIHHAVRIERQKLYCGKVYSSIKLALKIDVFRDGLPDLSL